MSAAARAAARKKGGRNRRTPDGPDVGAVTLRTVESAQQLLEQVVGATLQQENSGNRSRTLGYLEARLAMPGARPVGSQLRTI